MHLLSPKGFVAAAAVAGIRSVRKPDVAMLVCTTAQPATAAAVFTTNKVFAAPVKIGRENLAATRGRLRGVVVNAGNANACTGKQGDRDARRMCSLAAAQIGCDAQQILPCSTGIIGHLMPMQKVTRGITAAAQSLGTGARHANAFADSILTTDTRRKTAAARISIGKEIVTIAGACKGSGMIGPRMSLGLHATMLAFITTDAAVSVAILQRLLQRAADRTFNAVTVDDHTSTNDTAVVLASGASGIAISSQNQIARFGKALEEVCQSLAYQIAADGEGATKVVRINVERAASDVAARTIARAIANSPLVKCAMHGNDPNWGRIVSAAGMCGGAFDPDRSTLTLQRTRVFSQGRPLKFDATAVSRLLRAREVIVTLDCGAGRYNATVWTCDLSKEYVTINADYHT